MTERVRVTADTNPGAIPSEARSESTGPFIVNELAAAEADAVYVQGLVRAQLKLGLGCLVGFVATAGALAVLTTTIVALNSLTLWGVPLSWLMHAFGYYPIIFIFAMIYEIGARRNEQRYWALKERAA